MNYKKVMSVSVSEEVYRILKTRGNMSNYICELVLKNHYIDLNDNAVIEKKKKTDLLVGV